MERRDSSTNSEKKEKGNGLKIMIKPNQTVFRKGTRVVDNVHVLNYITVRRFKREKGSMGAMFVDFRVAFESLDREEIHKATEKKRIRDGLRKRPADIFIEMKERSGGGMKYGKEVEKKEGGL